MSGLISFRKMICSLAGDSSWLDHNRRDRCVKRNVIIDLGAAITGLSRHTILLVFKGAKPVTPSVYEPTVCYYACYLFENDRGVRRDALRGVEFHETTRWVYYMGQIIGVCCFMDGGTRFTLLFEQYEDFMRERGFECDVWKRLGGVEEEWIGDSE